MTGASQTVRLADWVARHGPLWPASAMVIVLQACADVSQLDADELGLVIGSLDVGHIVRTDVGDWRWRPVRMGHSVGSVGDREIVGRLGAISYHCLVGEAPTFPVPDEQALHAAIRHLRPDLPTRVRNLAVRAISTRQAWDGSLTSFAQEAREALGVENLARTRAPRRAVAWATVGIIGVSVALWAALRPDADARGESSGLTDAEITLFDIASESAQSSALVEEHTVAVQQYQQIGNWWRTRMVPEDPRLAWIEAHEAWVRELAGDRLTAEQLLQGKPSWLGAQLGDNHPYTRVVRLVLASTLEARGAVDEAEALRERAAGAARELLGGPDQAAAAATGSVVPGVRAHVAPNVPEREGFRRTPDGDFAIPLTSMQRWSAGHFGWRLHLVAESSCRTSVVVGSLPSRVDVDVSSISGRRWRVRIGGTTPPMAFEVEAGPVRVSIVADATGLIEARRPNHDPQRARLAATAEVPEPPYALTFTENPSESGCRVVWLEIPFPTDARSMPSPPAVTP